MRTHTLTPPTHTCARVTNGANGKRQSPFVCCKRKTKTENCSVCLLQTETENGSLFSLVGKRKKVMDVYCISKRALDASWPEVSISGFVLG
jgi:hypothetical protein